MATVAEERLCAATDQQIAMACQSERRCLVTLDMDFANPLLFRPAEYNGIAVLRLPAKATDGDLWDACQTLLIGLDRDAIDGKLWIVSRGRIREFRPEDAPGRPEQPHRNLPLVALCPQFTKAVNCDSIGTIPKTLLVERIAALGPTRLTAVNAAIRFALAIP